MCFWYVGKDILGLLFFKYSVRQAPVNVLFKQERRAGAGAAAVEHFGKSDVIRQGGGKARPPAKARHREIFKHAAGIPR